MNKHFTSPIDRASEMILLAHQKFITLFFFLQKKIKIKWRSPIYHQRYALFVKDHLSGVKNGQRSGKRSSTVLMLVEEKGHNLERLTRCAKKSPIFSLK